MRIAKIYAAAAAGGHRAGAAPAGGEHGTEQ
jgi:hypothetical protein